MAAVETPAGTTIPMSLGRHKTLNISGKLPISATILIHLVKVLLRRTQDTTRSQTMGIGEIE